MTIVGRGVGVGVGEGRGVEVGVGEGRGVGVSVGEGCGVGVGVGEGCGVGVGVGEGCGVGVGVGEGCGVGVGVVALSELADVVAGAVAMVTGEGGGVGLGAAVGVGVVVGVWVGLGVEVVAGVAGSSQATRIAIAQQSKVHQRAVRHREDTPPLRCGRSGLGSRISSVCLRAESELVSRVGIEPTTY